MDLITVRQVTLLAVILRIITAVIIGGLIGLERELKNRPAGLRTYMVVCVGACLIMLTNQYVFQVLGTGDPVRMGAQVISGIGFLGAGTIIVTRYNQIKGLTTAAGLWAAAGVGLAIGIGFYEAAIFGGFAIFIVVTLFQVMDNRMRRKTKNVEIYMELAANCSLTNFLREMRSKNVEITNTIREKDSDGEDGSRAYFITLHLPKRQHHVEILEDIRNLDGVIYVEEM